MKDTEAKRGVLITAFAGNFMLTLFRLVSLRIIYLTSRHSDIAIFVRLLSIIPMILITFFTFSLLGYFADRRNLKFRGDQYAKYKKYLKGSGKAMIFFIALTAAFVLFCGVLSVIIYSLLGNIMSYDFIKNTIDVLTGVITLLISPFVLMQMLSLLITGLPLRRALRHGFEKARGNYMKLCALALTFYAAGLLVNLLISNISGNADIKLVEIVLYTILGGISTFVMFTYGINILIKETTER